jgi:hypothetical protein
LLAALTTVAANRHYGLSTLRICFCVVRLPFFEESGSQSHADAAAALYHHFWRRGTVLLSMLPGR